jgi:hypothetical protein
MLKQEESLAFGRPEVVPRLQHCGPLSPHLHVNLLNQLKIMETVLYQLAFPRAEICI